MFKFFIYINHYIIMFNLIKQSLVVLIYFHLHSIKRILLHSTLYPEDDKVRS